MRNLLTRFEKLARLAWQYSDAQTLPKGGVHPFDDRGIHGGLPLKIKLLFDDGHFTQSTFEAYKFIEKIVRQHSRLSKSGFKLMMDALKSDSPPIKLTALTSESEKDEQKGYQFIFAGSILAIRNPRGHEVEITDSLDQCLDHLSLVSLLLRRLEESGFDT